MPSFLEIEKQIIRDIAAIQRNALDRIATVGYPELSYLTEVQASLKAIAEQVQNLERLAE